MEPLYRDKLGTFVPYSVEPLYKGQVGVGLFVPYTVEPLYKGQVGGGSLYSGDLYKGQVSLICPL